MEGDNIFSGGFGSIGGTQDGITSGDPSWIGGGSRDGIIKLKPGI